MTTPQKQWGITPPINSDLPTATDNAKNDALVAELKKQNNYESPAETEKRKSTLHLLYRITLEFVKEASKKRGFADKQLDQFGGKIFPYGSYRLGVYGPGSDIDTLVVAPRHVSREDFFEIFPSLLEKMSPAGAIGFLTPVPDAFVPIIKMELNNIEIDLIFARIASLHTVPVGLDLKDNSLLKGLDERELRSVNGTRVTDEILSLVPQPKTFRTALRAIKLWAQRRAIYANIMGFPGGVAWAMLVARVCQLYPAATGSTIIGKFFAIIGKWNWPSPILLKQIESGSLKVWNPQIYPSDRRNIMPIITPAYPSMCATFNISKSGKEIILRELKRGGEVVNKILAGQLQWVNLFDRHTFFTLDHKYYLSVVAWSNNKDAALAWSGMVESKVRILVLKLEDQTDVIDLARPFTKGYERVHKCKTDSEVEETKKGSVKYQTSETQTTDDNHDPKRAAAVQDGVDVDGESEAAAQEPETEDGGQIIYTTTFYIGLDVKPNNKNLNIAYPIQAFRDTCLSWANYNPQLHELQVTPTRSFDLPDDVFDFDQGDVKPVKPKKKGPTAVKKNIQGQKRSIDELDPHENGTNGTAKRQASTPAMSATPA